MKRLLLSILTLLLVLPVAVAESTPDYTIEFTSTTADTGDYTDSKWKSDVKVSDSNLISKWTYSKAYPGDNGVRLGSGSANGNVIATLSSELNVEKIVLSVSQYSNNTIPSIKFNDGSSSYTQKNGIVTIPVNGKISSIKIEGAGTSKNTYRFQLSKIEIYLAASKLTATITPKSYDAKELSVGESVAASDLFSVDVADGTDVQKAAAADKLMVKLADNSDDAYVTISDDGKSVKAKNYKSGTNNTISLIGYIKDVDGVTDTETSENSNTNAFLYVKPYIELSDLMPEKLLVGQTVYIPYTTYPEEAKDQVVVTEIYNDKFLSVTAKEGKVKLTALKTDSADPDNFFTLNFASGSGYTDTNGFTTFLTISEAPEGTTPKAVTSEPAATNGELSISAGDAVTFSSNGATSLHVTIEGDNIEIDDTFDGSSYTYTFNTPGEYLFEITPLTTDTKGLVYYYEGLKAEYDVTVEAVEQQAVELEIVGDTEYTIAYNGGIKGGWVTVKDEAQVDALKDITYSTEVVAGKPVVAVDTDGTIVAGNPGTVKVIASLNSTKYKADPVSITVTIGKKPIVLSVNEDAAKEVTVYGEIAAGWLTATMNGTVDADALSAVLYDYNSDYVDVENGKITAKKSGIVTITATIPEDNPVYQIRSVTYTITINKASVTLKSTDKAVATVMEGSTVEDWFAVDLGDLSENEEAQAEVKQHIGYELGKGSADYVTVEEGKITAVAAGEATVTAVLMDNDYFIADPSTLTYSLTVTEKPQEFTFDFTKNDYGMTRHDSNNGNDTYNDAEVTIDSSLDPEPQTDPLITIYVKTADKKNRLWSTNGWRILKSTDFNMTISVPEGYEITKLEGTGSLFTFSKLSVTPTGYSTNTGTWSGDPYQSISFSAKSSDLTGSKDMGTIKVSYQKASIKEVVLKAEDSALMKAGEKISNWVIATVNDVENEDAQKAVAYEIVEGSDVVSVAEDGTITALKVGKATVKASLSEGSKVFKYAEDATDVTISLTILPGEVKCAKAWDDGSLSILQGTDVEFKSAGADYLKVCIEDIDNTIESIVENPYTHNFAEMGLYKLTVTPLTGTDIDNLTSYSDYGLSKNFKVVVATGIDTESATDEISISTITKLDDQKYSIESYSGSNSGVLYKVRAMKTDNKYMQINTTQTNTGANSGIGSFENDNNRVIQSIVVTMGNTGDYTNLIVKAGTKPCTTIIGGSSSVEGISPAEDAIEITPEVSGNVYTYIPVKASEYFSITSSENVKIEKVVITYEPKYDKADPEMELCKDQDGTVAESKVLQYYMSDAYESIDFDELIYSSVSATDREGVTNVKTVVTYTSSDPKVATVNEKTGEVTILRMGTTVITATYPGNDNYVPTKASYTINVGFMNPTAEAEGTVPVPLVFDQYDILLPKEFITNVNNGLENYFIETVALSVRHKPGYKVYYSQNMERIGDEGTFDKKPTESPAGVRAYDSESNSEDNWEELTMTGSDSDSYATGIFEPYAEGKYASTIKFKAVDSAGNKSEEVVLNLSKPTGVSTVDAEESSAEAVYYNLQGQRVKNPERGIYIRVIGNRATKVAM